MAQVYPRPRQEHPRPQFYRENWQNLNGVWDFDFDFGESKKDQGWQNKQNYPSQILVPFCPESRLSGVEYRDFISALWYHKRVAVTQEQLEGRVLLHFGAVDYHCEVFVNGEPAGSHDGGYTSFCLDITGLLRAGENSLTVYASDHVRSGKQPSGKQCGRYSSEGCLYTRTTGIWQTVWLEFVPEIYMERMETIPDPDNACVHIKVYTNKVFSGMRLEARAFLEDENVGERSVRVTGTCTSFSLPVSEVRLWEPGQPVLYDLRLELTGGDRSDSVLSYFGLRKTELSEGMFLLNGKPLFQRLVLDQGFYPDGIYTAPDDEALKRDILMSMNLGFNGARLHQKVFEERFLYWADKLGYLVWGEFPNWGLDISEGDGLCIMLPQWLEAVKRDYNHPSIIGWCPFNETWDCNGRRQEDKVLSGIYYATKAVDSTRPVIDTSGNFHVVTDIYDIHDYEQDPVKFQALYGAGQKPWDNHSDRQQYGGQPYFISEYGGTWWQRKEEAAPENEGEGRCPENGQDTAFAPGGTEENGNEDSGWGYGARPRTQEEAADRIVKLTEVLLKNPKVCGFCYTQLTDVEQEQNGLYTYDRKPKFSEEIYAKIREGFSAPAAGEIRAEDRV